MQGCRTAGRGQEAVQHKIGSRLAGGSRQCGNQRTGTRAKKGDEEAHGEKQNTQRGARIPRQEDEAVQRGWVCRQSLQLSPSARWRRPT
jgi:hypothetical protein